MGKFAENSNLGKRVLPLIWPLRMRTTPIQEPQLKLSGDRSFRNINCFMVRNKASAVGKNLVKRGLWNRLVQTLCLNAVPILKDFQWRSQEGGHSPLAETLTPLLPPKWNYTLYRGLWRAAILSPSQLPPAHPSAPLAAPSFWKVWLRPWRFHI